MVLEIANSARGGFERVALWFRPLAAVIQRIRTEKAQVDPAFDRHLQQARLVYRLAGEVPIEDSTGAAIWIVALTLYRQSALWALAALLDHEIVDLVSGLNALSAESWNRLLDCTTGVPDVPALSALFDTIEPKSDDNLPARCSTTRRVVACMLQEANRRRNRYWRRPIARLLKSCAWPTATSVVLAAVLFSVAGRSLWQATEIAAGAPWRASSAAAPFGALTGNVPIDTRAQYFFHTTLETDPWLSIELKDSAVSRVDVENRDDCCETRAIPLVVETSEDGTHWTEVARQSRQFKTWSAHFARRSAHWIRLRATRRTSLHLKGVKVFR